ncbi:MAG TPA: alpha/beta fold hydrolase [Polyangia bacterium]|nr:alpha/beta fold hydrolase [Polyangia bacterium]
MIANDAAPPPDATPTIGDYRLQRRLGSGAMGEVWLGRHTVTGTLAAVKLLRQNVKSRERVAKTFDRERRAIGRLGHPHIVALFDVGPDWLATAYVDGTDLARRLKTPIDPATAVHLALQIASALAHAHAYGVVHRDVKPSNILLDTAGNAFLADFGLALLPEAIDDEHRVGTPAYMAPEQAAGALAGPTADQYALARTLLEMLVGGTLPLNPNEALAELPAQLPAALRAALARASAVAPSDRFAEISDFAAALAAVDLTRHSAPRRLAPEVRVRTPFGWTAGAARAEMLAPDLSRADFQLSALAEARLLPSAALERFAARSGYADVGFTVYGNSGRLGRLTDPSAFARATEVVVLVHGMFCNRDSWAPVAPSVARDNAQALVLAVDHSGFGASRFAAATPAAEHASPRGVCTMLLAWLELLGLRDLPTVLVGHSFGGAALLTVRDDELGERVSRLAITPVFPAVDKRYRTLLKATANLLPTLGAISLLRKLMAKMFSTSARDYTRREQRLMAAEFEHASPRVISTIARQYALSAPAAGDQLQRCLVAIADVDPVAPARILEPALDALGFPRTHIRHLVATGGHFPHAEQDDHPEWTLRNVADLAACVNAMLRASSEGTPMPTEVASTMIGSTDV